MTKERELLRRALEDWDFSDKFETLDPIFEEIRTYLSTTSDDAEEPVEFKFIPTGKELLRYHPDEDCIETKVEFANYPAGSKFYPPKPAEPEAEPVAWFDGEPPKPYGREWFIAETTYGDKVVLKALPDDYSYDYKTADETYIKADKIKRWMQFPDSNYCPPNPSPTRKPMTEEEISKLFPTMPTEYEAGFREGIRFAEKHHGITDADL